MDDFKSWLVANIEVVLIILTVLMLVVVGFLLIPKFLAGNEIYGTSFFMMLMVIGILCTILVSCIRNGFLSFVALSIFVGLLVLGGTQESSIECEPDGVEVVDRNQVAVDMADNDVDELFSQAAERFRWSWLIWISVIAFPFGIYTSVYANQNFDDVVSRRFLYRNSNVSVFEVRWKYTFNRFYAGFMTVFALGLELILIIILRP